MATTALRREVEIISPTRKWVMGILFLVCGIAVWLLFARNLEIDVVTKFGMTVGGAKASIPNLVLPSRLTLIILSLICVVLGIIQLSLPVGFRKRTNLVLGIVAGLFIFGFLTWAAAGKSLNLAGLLNTTLSKAVPLTLGALSGILCERAGVVNIAIEGMMLMGAMVGALVGSITHDLWLGLLAAVAAGALLGLVHGVLSL